LSEPFDIHEGYAGLVLVGFALTLLYPSTRDFTNPGDKQRYYTMQMITALGAVFGAKLAVLLGDALWPLRPFNDWWALAGSGRSIAGALLFGFLSVEIAKPLLKYDIPPNDRFALVLPFSIGIGRIGCLIAGCCRGLPHDGPLSITYGDGIPRYPAQLYELLFHFGAGLLLIALWRRNILFGRLFAAYLAAYGLFRFASEFIRETEKPYFGLSAYQLMSLAMIIAGLAAIAARTLHQPESWDRWKKIRGAQ
jgi:phosphatidylglycerol:prolipoprotein diacylglycerol transferase